MRSYWIAATKGQIGSIYNIGGNKIIEISKFLQILKKKSKVKIPTMIDKNLLRKTDVTLQIPDVKKFKKQTNWKPKVKFENSVNSLLEEFRKKQIIYFDCFIYMENSAANITNKKPPLK